MMFYLLLLLSGVVVTFVSQYAGSKRAGTSLCLAVVVVLGAVASLRGYVGTDTYTYHLQYEAIDSQDDAATKFLIAEPAFVVLAGLVGMAGGNSFVYVAAIGVLQTLLLIFILKRIGRPALFLMFYVATFYLNFHFNIIRASTAALIIMMSFLWINEGGPKFYLTLWSSIFFHYTAIAVVIYVLLYKQVAEKKYASAVFSIFLVLLMIGWASQSILNDALYFKYGEYWQAELLDERAFGIGFLLQLLLYAGLVAAMFMRSTINGVFFALPVMFIKLSAVYYPIVDRVEGYILPLFILLLTKDVIKSSITDLSPAVITVLSLLNVYGATYGLAATDKQALDEAHRASPYVPYHTMFDIK